MPKDTGWIKLHRKIQDTDGYFNEPFCRNMAWVDMLLLANHDEKFFRVRGIRVIIKRGQIGFTSEKLSERWKWSRGKVLRFLKELQIDGQIVQQKSNVTTLISIVNYNAYQDGSTTNKTASSTTDGTTNGQQTVQQTDINKNDNNYKNEKEEEIIGEKHFENMLVQEMIKIWKQHYPKHIEEAETDFPAVLQIAYKIAKLKEWNSQEVLNGKMPNTLEEWDKISKWVRNDKFYKKLSLEMICKKFNAVSQSMDAEKEDTPNPMKRKLSAYEQEMENKRQAYKPIE